VTGYDPLLSRFAWHDLPPALQPMAVPYAARAVELIEQTTAALRVLLAEREAALRAAEQPQ
jgi:hypothetical protein